ncbi:MAG: hypothetical protein PVG96_13300 [Desulfobacterales bacterium]|jgi:hypothetical protein
MSQKSKFWGIFTGIAVMAAIFMLLFNVKGTRDKVWQLLEPDMIAENAELKNKNARLSSKIEDLETQNRSLKTYLEAYENNFVALKDVVGNCSQIQSMFPIELPDELAKERFEIRQIYRQMRSEKKRWDKYQQERYKNILETTLEPAIVESQSLDLENEENLEYFLEMENALKLHRRLIRDVRVFHDEIQFQKKQHHAQQEYELYDLKFKLAPFARESALVDALQQAMSALSAGIYEQEAVAVLDRIGDEFTKPIQHLYEMQLDTTASLVLDKYNYNFYTVFGKKLMDYSDNLTQQSSITLGPSAFRELDFFNRYLSESLYDLYYIGQEEAIDPAHLDLNELEQVLNSKN